MYPLLWNGLLFLATLHLARENHCSPLGVPRAEQRIVRILSEDVDDLLWQLRQALPNTTLLLPDGIYRLSLKQSLEVNTPGITIRSDSGNREGVIIDGGYNNVSLNADDSTIADLTLRNPRFHNVQVRGEKGVSRAKIYNVHLVDAGQQFVKVSTGDGTLRKFADEGLVACSLIEYSTFSQGTDVSPPSYTNGVDILAGKGWIIRDNIFRKIRSEAGPAGPAILVWKNAADTVIQRNLIVDSWRGIALGLSAPDGYSRGGTQVVYDHQNGVVENNVILALHEPADAAIENNYAANSHLLHNTIYYNESIKHSVEWSIEYRFPPTTVFIANNLTNRLILKRFPLPTQESQVEGNITVAQSIWFQNIMAENFHLTSQSPARDRGIALIENLADIDGDARLSGDPHDVGADEYSDALE